jgi:hypothetical protein
MTKPSAAASQEHKLVGPERRVGIGDRTPKPEDPNKPKAPETKAEIAVKPLYQAQWADGAWVSQPDRAGCGNCS